MLQTFKNYDMKCLQNFKLPTEYPTVGVLAFFAVLILAGCAVYWKWETKGLFIGMGIMLIIIGIFVTYMAITDNLY